MGEPTKNLEDWLKRVQSARSHKGVFEILDQFRALDWTDEQCAVMAHTYMRVIDNTKDTTKDQESKTVELPAKDQESGTSQQQAADAPVWYEKM